MPYYDQVMSSRRQPTIAYCLPQPMDQVTVPVPGIDKCCACQKRLGKNGLRFPKDVTLRKMWVDAILAFTPDYPGKSEILNSIGIQVCVSHFNDNVLIRKTDGHNVTYGLKKGSVPSIFGLTSQRRKRFSSEQRLSPKDSSKNGGAESQDFYIIEEETVINETVTNGGDGGDAAAAATTTVIDIEDDDQSANCSQGSDSISSLTQFVAVLRLKKDSYFEPWKLLYLEKSVLFCLFDEEYKQLVQSFRVGANLEITVYYNGQPMETTELMSFLGAELRLDTWHKFKMLVLYLHKILDTKDNIVTRVKQASNILDECHKMGVKFDFPEKTTKKWKFIADQVSATIHDDPTYSKETVKWAFDVYSVNKAGYIKIFNSETITMPHPASLELYKKGLKAKVQQNNRKSAVSPAISTVQAAEENIPEVLIDDTV